MAITFKRQIAGSRKGVAETLTLHIAKAGQMAFPKWLDKLIANDVDTRRLQLFDHRRHIGCIAYCEPYSASGEEIAVLVRFCEMHNLHFAFIGITQHYPSLTLRIVIWRPQDDAKHNKAWEQEEAQVC